MKNFVIRFRYFLLLLLFPLLVSCTPGFFYNNLDRISLWYINDYISLTSTQKKEYAWRFNEIQQWHRKYELDNYRLFLSAINRQIGSEALSEADIEQAVAMYHQQAMVLWINLGYKIYPHLHELTLQLSNQQKQELISNLSAKNLSYFENIKALSNEEKQEKKSKRLKKNISRWVGSFTDEQEQMIQQWAKDLYPLDQSHYEFRRHWIAELNKSLLLPASESKVRLEQLLANREAFMALDYHQKLKENRELTEKLIAKLLISRTTKQQKTLVQEINNWLDLIGRVIQS